MPGTPASTVKILEFIQKISGRLCTRASIHASTGLTYDTTTGARSHVRKGGLVSAFPEENGCLVSRRYAWATNILQNSAWSSIKISHWTERFAYLLEVSTLPAITCSEFKEHWTAGRKFLHGYLLSESSLTSI